MSTPTPVRLPRATPVLPSFQPWHWPGGLTAAYASQAGRDHARNEDCCSHIPSGERPGFCGVADGVGGGAHGDIASRVLLAHCARAPKEAYSNPGRLIAWLNRADSQVRAAVARRTHRTGAATLAAAWFPSQGTAYLLNVGDCRVYQLKPRRRGYAIRQLTVDQTYASFSQSPPLDGRPDDPARMVGAGAVGVPPVVRARIRARGLLLLCSDGVHRFVSDGEMAGIVSNGLRSGDSLRTICGRLVHAARRNGSRDDASALLVMRRQWFRPWWMYAFLLAVALLLCLAGMAFAETQSVIDPVAAPEPERPPAPTVKESQPEDAEAKRERRRADAEQRRRARAEARALAAENEAAKLRAAEEERAANAAAAAAAEKAAARKAAAARAARVAAAKSARAKAAETARREAQRQAAAREAAARKVAAREAAESKAAAREAAARKVAAREAIAKEMRETAAREATAREAAAREAAREVAAREAAAREAAAREAAAREAAVREAAARDAAVREAAAREAAREAAAREAAREAAAREAAVREAAVREAGAREAAAREAAAKEAAAREAVVREAAAKEAAVAGSRAQHGQLELKVFRDCIDCPEVVWLPKGELPPNESAAASGPRYALKMSYVLAVGRFKVSNAEWAACVADRGCRRRPDGAVVSRGRDPVTNVSWQDAQQYAAWLSRRTSKPYRLLTGAEWEYAARAGAEVYDMHGGVSEWVENCYQYRDPRNGKSGWTLECTNQTLRGGAPRYAAGKDGVARSYAPFNHYDDRIGFRIGRTE